MELHHAVNAGLTRAFAKEPGQPTSLDEFGRASYRLVVGPDAEGDSMKVDIALRMGPANKSFTISCPLKALEDKPDAEGMFAGLATNIEPDSLGGGHLAIDEVAPALILVRHWAVPEISDSQFDTFILDFSTAAVKWTRMFRSGTFQDKRFEKL